MGAGGVAGTSGSAGELASQAAALERSMLQARSALSAISRR